jgi:hypothetical protein
MGVNMLSVTKISVTILAAIALSGCGTTSTTTHLIYKQGTTIYKKQADLDECKIQSFREIPQALAQNVTAGSSSSGTTYCSGSGNNIVCNTYGAYTTAPTINTYDVNQRLRNNYMQQCLERKGYIRVTVPYCTDGGGYDNRQPAPPLNQIKCINRDILNLQP